MLPSPEKRGSAFEVQYSRGRMVHLRYGPMTLSQPLDSFAKRLQDYQYPPPRDSSYGALDSDPDRTLTHCSCQPWLDARFPVRID